MSTDFNSIEVFFYLALSLSASVEGMSVSTIRVMFSVDFLVSLNSKIHYKKIDGQNSTRASTNYHARSKKQAESARIIEIMSLLDELFPIFN